MSLGADFSKRAIAAKDVFNPIRFEIVATENPAAKKIKENKMMKNRVYLVSISAVFAMLLAGSSFGQARESAISANQAIVGSWSMTVTSDTFPVPFRGMVTFAEGGGVVASAQGDVLLQAPPGVPPVATAAHGAWLRTSNREFLFTFRQIFYDANGDYAGGAKIRNAATIDAFGSSLTGHLIVQYYDANDQLVFTGAGSFVGSRIVAETLNP
jgi:hypothetical protein